MTALLASDDNNPDFVNAKDPDSMLHVEFYDFAAPDQWAITVDHKPRDTRKPECPYVRIQVPGNKDLTIERPADGNDQRRFPRQWLHFQMQSGKIANAQNVPGWPIEQWPDLVPDQIKNLHFLNFYTVEQLAGASDAQVGAMMGGYGLRSRAQAAVQLRNGKQVSEAVAERDAKIGALEGELSQIKAMLQQLLPKPVEPVPVTEGLDYHDPNLDKGRGKLGLPKREGASA